MTANPMLAEVVDVERLEKVARAATPGPWMSLREQPVGAEDDAYSVRTLDQRDIAWLVDTMHGKELENSVFIATFDPPTVLALLSRLRAAEHAERMLCENCGTITRDAECDCTRVDLADRQRLVNYADAMAHSAAELAAQNAVLRAALEQLRPDYDENEARQRGYMDDPEISEVERIIYQRRIDHVRKQAALIDAAFATTPAEALEKIRMLIAWAESMAAPGTKFTHMRRIFGSAR